jgi:transposase-like protein
VILLAVRWHLRYGLSHRDIEELLAERAVDVDHVTIYGWVQRFTPLVIEAARVGARNSVVAGQAAFRYSLMRPSHRLDLMTRRGS